MIKHIFYNRLFDCYKNLLTEKQRETFILYHSEDNSLLEIAEMQHASKQAVSEIVRRTEAILDNYEEKLGLIRQKEDLAKRISGLFDELYKQNDCEKSILDKIYRQLIDILESE